MADKLSHCAAEADLPQITLEYYEKDTLKEGGYYLYKTGQVKKIDPYNQEIVFVDGIKIAITDIAGISLQNLNQYLMIFINIISSYSKR